MARVAFYAPMKSPDSPTPSGDREMARNLLRAIAAEGDKVELVSQLRIYDKHGDAAAQDRMRQAAQAEAERLMTEMPHDTAIWVTYHNYYKAPDLLGPAVCRARGIPYVQLESTRASRRLTGPWSTFAQAAHDACDMADIVFYHTANDLITLRRDKPGTQVLAELPPFLPLSELPAAATCNGPMLAVGMMRDGDKLGSYQILAETLAHLTGDWRLDIAGDGPARDAVRALMAPFAHRVRLLGQLDRTKLQAAYGNASLFIWPGVNEAYGMVYLEAQAHGLPVVAQDRPGVRDVLTPGDHPSVDEGPRGLAARAQSLLADPAKRLAEGARARVHVAARHLMPSATSRFWAAARPLVEART